MADVTGTYPPSGSGSGGLGITQLTGDVTAIGPGVAAATVAAIQGTTVTGTTGTGKVVFDHTPTLITPVIGAATGTSLSVSGQLTSTVATGTAPLAVSSTTLVPNLYVARAVLADSATLNANLTGPITSVGNATSIASQTGTGTKFVVDTSPTLVTPNIGAATGTSLQLSGLTASTALVTDASKNLTSSPTTATQIALLQFATGSVGAGNLVFSIGPALTSPVLTTPVLGTPSSGTLTSCTGLPIDGGTTGTLPVNRGGTGATTLASHGVLVGNGTGTVAATAVGTTGQVLTGVTGADPVWASPATSGTVTSVAVSGGTTGLTTSGGPITSSGTITLAGTLIVGNGGTGATTLTNHGVLVGAGTSAVSGLTAGTDGQFLQGQTGANPAWTNSTGSGSVVLATSPTLVTPTIGVATATSVNKVAITAPATSATLTLADGSTLATSGAFSTTLTATAATNVTLPTSGTLATTAIVTNSADGLMPAAQSSFSDTTATRLGYKTYVGGTNYNGGISPTVTGTNSWATDRAVSVPYQDQAGNWRMRFNVRGHWTSSTSVTLTFTGTTFFNQEQNFSARQLTDGTTLCVGGYIPGNTSGATIVFNASVNTVALSGDVELASKPTWAY